MKCQDDDCFEDPIRLHFEETTPCLEKIQFLDPGIIDLDCDSDEDCSFVSEDPDDFSISRTAVTLHMPPVTSSISNTVCIKPMSIKIVDCFKFPWFFDQSTKYIIEKTLNINKNVNSNIMTNEEMNVDSEEFKNVSDTNCVNNGINTSMFIFQAISNKNLNNNLSGQIKDSSSNEHINIDEKYANDAVDNNRGICFDKGIHKYIDMKSVHKRFGTKMRVINRKKLLENYNRRNDIEKQRALNQRNKTTVDIKKNIGLVGMKIQRLTCEKQTMKTKTSVKKTSQTNKEKKLQKTLDKLYVKAVDKVLINIGTTITPVFDEIKRFANASEISHQNIHEDSIKPINRNRKICDNLENKNNAKELKHVSQQKGIESESMLAIINGSKIIAEEIVRLTTPTEKGVGLMKEKYKPSGDKIKVCNETHTVKKTEKSSLENQKRFDDSKITEMIAPMPLSIESRNKERFRSVTSSKAIETCEKKEYTSPVPVSYPLEKITDIKKNKHDQMNCSPETCNIIFAKHTDLSQKSGFDVENKWFTTLNRYTENILNKIKVMQHKQYKINKSNKLHKQYGKNPSNFVKSKSTEECKSMPRVVNITNDVPLDDKICKNVGLCTNFLDQSVKNNSVRNINDVTNTSKTQLQYSNKNQLEDLPDNIKCFPNNELHLPHYTTEPLNTSFVKVVKTDADTNNKVTFSEKNTQLIETDNSISSNKHTEHPTIKNQAGLKGKIQVTRIEIKQNHQANVTNKPTTVHNSMQAHILYRPQAENSQPPSQMFPNNSGFQVSKQHISQPIYKKPGNHLQYPSSYTEEILPNNIMHMNARLYSEVNKGIPPQMNLSIRPSLEGNGAISPQMAFNTRPYKRANRLSSSQSTAINGVNGGISLQMESNVRLMSAGVKCGNPPLPTFNIPLPGVISRISSEMAMNGSTAGINGDIPPQVARNDRPMPSSVSVMLPGKIIWSYEFPPPNPPPPPPPLPPTSQEIPGFPSTSQAVNSSIIGKNNDGIIKKINITAPVIDQNTETFGKKSIIIENIHSVTTPLYDQIATVDHKNSVSKTIESEISKNIQESDKDTHQKSPIKSTICSTSTHPKSTTGILCNFSAESHACPAMPRNLLPLQSNVEPINIEKKEKAQLRTTNENFKTTIPIVSNDTFVTNSKSVLPDKCHEYAVCKLRYPLDGYYKGSKNSKEITSVDKPSINRLTHSKAPPIKTNESTVTSSTSIQPRLSENNPRSVGNTKNTASKEITHSKTPPTKYKKKIKPSTKKLLTHLFEDSTRLAINPKKIDSDPVNLKKSQTRIDDAKNTPSVKYKPGPLSKKMPFNNLKEKDNPGKAKREQFLPSKGYSDPILPIPTYESFLSDVPDSCNKLLDRPVEKSNKPFDQVCAKMKKTFSMSLDEPPRNQNAKVDRIKKISLDEYKKKRLANERRNQKTMADFDTKKDITFKNDTADMPRRASNVDSDLGYDSDSTVIL